MAAPPSIFVFSLEDQRRTTKHGRRRLEIITGTGSTFWKDTRKYGQNILFLRQCIDPVAAQLESFAPPLNEYRDFVNVTDTAHGFDGY